MTTVTRTGSDPTNPTPLPLRYASIALSLLRRLLFFFGNHSSRRFGPMAGFVLFERLGVIYQFPKLESTAVIMKSGFGSWGISISSCA